MNTEVMRPGMYVRAFFAIAAMDVIARVGGFGRALAFAHWMGEGRSRSTSGDQDTSVDALARVVVAAAAFYPRRAMCLEQSLALFVLLRRRGIDADLRVGVQTLPFSAHAWVEVDGTPVNEKQSHIEQLATFQHVSI